MKEGRLLEDVASSVTSVATKVELLFFYFFILIFLYFFEFLLKR